MRASRMPLAVSSPGELRGEALERRAAFGELMEPGDVAGRLSHEQQRRAVTGE